MIRKVALVLATLGLLVGCDVLFPHRSAGEKLFRDRCAKCHGIDAAGNTPGYMGNPWADLRDSHWKNGGDPVSIERVIRAGVFGQMPPSSDLDEAQIRALIDYLRVLRGEKKPDPVQ